MKRTLALLYHEVIDPYDESGFQNKDNLAYMHKTEDFRRNLTIFLAPEYRNTLIDQYLLTFDDGGISNLKSARILEENNVNGLFFITTKRLNSKGFLSSRDVLALYQAGHVIGSHSHTHPMIFRTLTYKKMLDEWKTSKSILEEILSSEVNYCSIPGGDADLKTYESAVEAGFRFIMDSEPIIEPRTVATAEIIGRFSVKARTTDEQLKAILTLSGLKSLQRNRKIKSTVKKIIFPLHQYRQNRKNES